MGTLSWGVPEAAPDFSHVKPSLKVTWWRAGGHGAVLLVGKESLSTQSPEEERRGVPGRVP